MDKEKMTSDKQETAENLAHKKIFRGKMQRMWCHSFISV